MEAGSRKNRNDKLNFLIWENPNEFQRIFSRFLLLFSIFSLVLANDENSEQEICMKKKALSLTQKINSSLFLTQFPPFSLHRSRIAFPLHIKFSAFSHSLAGVRRPKIIHNLLYFSRCIRVLYIVHVPSLHLHTYRFSCSLSLLMIMKPPSNLRPGQFEVSKQKKKGTNNFFPLCRTTATVWRTNTFHFNAGARVRVVFSLSRSFSQPTTCYLLVFLFFQANSELCQALLRAEKSFYVVSL